MIGISLSAQNVAVKTNLLYDATTTFNLGAEIGLSPVDVGFVRQL